MKKAKSAKKPTLVQLSADEDSEPTQPHCPLNAARDSILASKKHILYYI